MCLHFAFARRIRILAFARRVCILHFACHSRALRVHVALALSFACHAHMSLVRIRVSCLHSASARCSRFACHVWPLSFVRGACVLCSHDALALRICASRLRFTSARHSIIRVQFYSAARKSHTTQTSTLLSFFTSKEKSCAQRVLTRGSECRIVDGRERSLASK